MSTPFSHLLSVLKEWPLFVIPIALTLVGISTMSSFSGEGTLASRHLLWLFIGIGVFFFFALIDVSFLRRTSVIVTVYFGTLLLLILLLLVADPVKGARAWFTFGAFSFQPADIAKVVCIALLAKYFSRRHVFIRDFMHIVVSGLYVAIPILLILVQPDLGTAVILSLVWLGMVLFSGISRTHLMLVIGTAVLLGGLLFTFGLHEYQKTRIISFLNPASDIHGAGYNAFQAMVAVGSGQVLGKGIGQGTQSELHFLPEYETDFIFAAFAEEWGFVGVVLVLLLFLYLFFHLISLARRTAVNFDSLFIIGVTILLFAHTFIHAGINVGLLPVTGTTIPFMSYGGSHLVSSFAMLGMVASLARHARVVARTKAHQELVGLS